MNNSLYCIEAAGKQGVFECVGPALCSSSQRTVSQTDGSPEGSGVGSLHQGDIVNIVYRHQSHKCCVIQALNATLTDVSRCFQIHTTLQTPTGVCLGEPGQMQFCCCQ